MNIYPSTLLNFPIYHKLKYIRTSFPICFHIDKHFLFQLSQPADVLPFHTILVIDLFYSNKYFFHAANHTDILFHQSIFEIIVLYPLISLIETHTLPVYPENYLFLYEFSLDYVKQVYISVLTIHSFVYQMNIVCFPL